jgi:N-acetylglucosaminyldiphosphoundecaprenol N-acetyl-beta-D-mannosaminyltransferase
MIGIEVPLLGSAEVLDAIARAATGSGRVLILSGNAHFFNLCRRNRRLRSIALDRASGIRVDGAGVVLACKLSGLQCPARCTWADFARPFAAFCADNGYRPYLLGGAPGVAAAAARRWRRSFPRLQVAGHHHGFFDKAPGSAENRAVLADIAATRPDALIVGFGMPLQEQWIDDNWARLTVPAILTGGAVFDYLSGNLRRPPEWMGRVGLEWLGRWAIEPRRLAGRYMLGLPAFLGHVAVDAFRWRTGIGASRDRKGSSDQPP